jgi:protein involved in polysaccharide export with SLBB domain
MKSIALRLLRVLSVAAVLISLVPLAGCTLFHSAPAGPVGTAPDLVPSDGGPAVSETNAPLFKADTIHAGDRIIISFSGLSNPPPPHEEQVRDDGHVKPPLIAQPVMAAGRTVGELQDELYRLYVPAFFKAVTIVVTVRERYFFVGGEVKMPGQKPYLSQMTVVKAVQAAGDATDYGDRKHVSVTRADGTRVVVDCKKALRNPKFDLPVYPGDVINVPRRIL